MRRRREDSVGDILEDNRNPEQIGRAIDDRLRPCPLEAQPCEGLMDLLSPLETRKLLSEEPAMSEFGDPHELHPPPEQDDGKRAASRRLSEHRSRAVVRLRVLIDEFDDGAGRPRALELIEELTHRRLGATEGRRRGEHELPAFEEALDLGRVGDVDPADAAVQICLTRDYLGPAVADLIVFEQTCDVQPDRSRRLGRGECAVH